MTKIKEVYDFINNIAPFDSAMEYDNVGLLIGNLNTEISSAIVSLDVTFDVIEEALNLGANLIISHHPVIFNPVKKISSSDLIYKLIENKIAVISAHTNLDMAKGGVNDSLSYKIGLKDIGLLFIEGAPLGRIGNIEEMTVENFVDKIKIDLSANAVRYVKGSKNCKNIAVICGSGGDGVDVAISAGADTLLTGEVKYNHFHYALQKGINLIEAGHFATENVIVPVLKKLISEKFFDLEFYISEKNTEIPLII